MNVAYIGEGQHVSSKNDAVVPRHYSFRCNVVNTTLIIEHYTKGRLCLTLVWNKCTFIFKTPITAAAVDTYLFIIITIIFVF